MAFKPLSKEADRLRARIAVLEKSVADATWAKSEAQASLRHEQALHGATKASLVDERTARIMAEDRHATLLQQMTKKNGVEVQPKHTGYIVRGGKGADGKWELEMIPRESETKH